MDQYLPIELSVDNLPDWLAAQGLLAAKEEVRVRGLTGGVSNLAFWVEIPAGSRAPFVVKQARPQLAVKMEWRADVGRVLREAEAMQWLHQRIGPPRIPRLLHLDRDAKALAMEAIEPPAENYKTLLLRGDVRQDMARSFGHLLAEIHNATADEDTREAFGDATFFDQLRLGPYYGTAGEVHPEIAGRLAALRTECLEERYCLVHGDYSPKNVLVRGKELVLLDYEVAHWGNPSFDLGFALTHYLCKALHLPAHSDAFIQAARSFWGVYREAITLPPVSRIHAGDHLAAVMLARIDGKSPLEYFTNESRRDFVRSIAVAALTADEITIDAIIESVAAEAAEVATATN